MARWISRICVVVILLGLGGAVSAPAWAGIATPYQVDYFQFNMAGNTINHGRLDVAYAVERSIVNRNPRPRVITLEEVCWNQWNELQNYLRPYGYPTAWFQWNGRDYCDNGAYFGIAMIHQSTGQLAGVWRLPDEGGHEPRNLVCVLVTSPRHYACVTHIDYHSPNKANQTRFVADRTHELWLKGPAVIVGGDFNAEPTDDALDPMYLDCYGGGAYGIYEEADGAEGGGCYRGGEATLERAFLPDIKVDYVFSSWEASVRYGDATFSDYSDHDPLWAGITLYIFPGP